MLKGTLSINTEQGYADFDCYADNTETGDLNIQVYSNVFDPYLENLAKKEIDDEEFWGTFLVKNEEFTSAFPRCFFLKTSSGKVKTNFTSKNFIGLLSTLITYPVNFLKINTEPDENRCRSGVVDLYGNTLAVALTDRRIDKVSVEIEGKFKLELNEEINIKDPEYTFLQGKFKSPVREDKYGNIVSPTPIKNLAVKIKEFLDVSHYGSTFENKADEYFNLISPSKKNTQVDLLAYYQTFDDLCDAHPDKDFSWLLKQDYHVLDDSNFEAVLEEFMAFDGEIGFDTETSSKHINFLGREGIGGQLVGVVLSKEEGVSYYLPTQHKLFDNVCGGDHKYFMEKYMAPLLTNKKIVCHNASFEHKVCFLYDIIMNCVYDTMVALGCTKRYEHADFEIGLKATVERRFKLDQVDLDDIVVCGDYNESGIAFWDLPKELVRLYACTDADMTLREYHEQIKEDLIGQYEAHDIFQLELDFAGALAYAEFFGFYQNPVSVKKLQEKVEEDRAKMLSDLKKSVEKFNPDFNPGSPKQLGNILYDFFKVEQSGKKRSTNKETLKRLQGALDEKSDAGKFVNSILKFRQVDTLFKNYTSKIDEHLWEGAYIFPGTFAFGTITGRCSTGSPNYQSFDDNVKKEVTGRPGYTCFNTDQTQVEYRILAAMSGEESLISFFQNVFRDYHTYQSARVIGKPYALVTDAERSKGKGVNFGLPYGMADASLAKACKCTGSYEELKRQGAHIRKRYFIGQDKVLKFFEGARNGGVDNGFTKTYYGRRRYYHPELFDEGSIRRQAGNHVIQGTAADVYKKAVTRLYKRIIQEDLFGLVLINGFIHDEVQCEYHNSINPDFILKMWREEFVTNLEGVDIRAGIGFGKCWYDAKNIELHPYFTNKYYEENLTGDVPKFDDRDNLEMANIYNEMNDKALLDAVLDGIKSVDNDYLEPAFVKIIYGKVGDYLKEKGYSYDKELGLTDEILKKYDCVGLDEFQANLKIFTVMYNLNYSELSILTPKDTGSSETTVGDIDEDFDFDIVDVKRTFIEAWGYYFDSDNGVFYCSEVTYILKLALEKKYFLEEGLYPVTVFKDGKYITTKAFVNYKQVEYIGNLYKAFYNNTGTAQTTVCF